MPAGVAAQAPALAVLASVTSLCIGAMLAKRLFPVIGVEATTLYRVGVSALVLLALHRPWRMRRPLRSWRNAVGFGLVLGAMNLCFYHSLRTLPLGVAIALEFTGPLAVAIGSGRRALDFVWIALAVTGVALLLPLWQFSQPLDPGGVVFALAAGVLWAGYILLGRTLGSSAGAGLSVSMLSASLLVLPVALIVQPAGVGRMLEPGLLLSGAGLAVLSGLLPYSLEVYALARMPAATFSLLLSLEPAVGAVVAMVLSAERLHGVQWFAIACVVAASAGKALETTRRARGAGAAGSA